MDIRITQTRPILGIETQRTKLELKNNGKIDYKVSHSEPKVQISTTGPKLHIDQTQAFADANLKNIKDFREEWIQYAKQQAMEFIGKKAQEGDRLAAIERGDKPIIDIAKENTTTQIDFTYGEIPSHPPEISVERGEVNVELIRGEVNTEYNHVPIEINFTPPGIKYYMIQEPSLNIEYVGNNIDTKI